MPALHAPLTLRAVAHLDVEAPHEGTHLGQVFLILRRHTVQRDRAAAVRTARRGRRQRGSRQPASAAGGAPACRTQAPARRPGRPPRPCGRSLAKGAACRAVIGAPRRLELTSPACSLRRFALIHAPRSASDLVSFEAARCARPEGLAEAVRTTSNRRGHRSCAQAYFTYRHRATPYDAHLLRGFSRPRPANRRLRRVPFESLRAVCHGRSM